MKKIFSLSFVVALLIFSACKKEGSKIVQPAKESTKGNTVKVNSENPGIATIVTKVNDRYVADMGFGVLDFGNIYFYTGSFLDGEAVLAVDNYSAGGPYITAPYSYLEGSAATNYGLDLQKFNTAWSNFIDGKIDPETHLAYPHPWPDDYIKDNYGTIGIFKGILVRDHSAASTVVIRAANFVPTPPAAPSSPQYAIGGVIDPNTGDYWFMWGHDGTISKVTKNGGNTVFPFSFHATYTGPQTNYHVIGTIKPTSTTSFSFNTYVSPL